jgi:hypothetical protein
MERDAQTESDSTPAGGVPVEAPAPAVEPLAAPADQGSGLASPIRHSRAELRAVERQREQETRRVPRGSVVAVWGVAALLFAYSFWQGLAVISAPPELLHGLTGGQRALSALVGAVLPLVAYGAAVWTTRRLSWWRAGIVFAAAWGASAAVWITFAFTMHAGR